MGFTLYTPNSFFLKIDFLLKRLKFSLIQIRSSYRLLSKEVSIQKLWIPVGRSIYESAYLEEILFVEAQNHYVMINLGTAKQYRVKSSLSKFFEKNLEEHQIFRKISRSYVVNLKRIERVENNFLIMEGNHKIPIPRERREEVLREVGVKFD